MPLPAFTSEGMNYRFKGSPLWLAGTSSAIYTWHQQRYLYLTTRPTVLIPIDTSITP